MFGDFMRIWESAPLPPPAATEPNPPRQPQLDRAREALERGPGGDLDADGRMARAGSFYVPALKCTVSGWLRVRERVQRGELGGEHDGLQRAISQHADGVQPAAFQRTPWMPPAAAFEPDVTAVALGWEPAREEEPPEGCAQLDAAPDYQQTDAISRTAVVAWLAFTVGWIAVYAAALLDLAYIGWVIGVVCLAFALVVLSAMGLAGGRPKR